MATSWDSVVYSVGRTRPRNRTPAVIFVILLLAGTGAAVYFLFFRDDALTSGPLVTPTPDASGLIPGATDVAEVIPVVAVDGEDELRAGQQAAAAGRQDPEAFAPDGVHPTELGAALIADCWLKAVTAD